MLYRSDKIQLHTQTDFQGMRQAGNLAARTLDFITPYLEPGVATWTIDNWCEQFIRDHGAIPAPKGYLGFPCATCISVNHVVCHGIPGPKRLCEGDIVNVDVTVILNGWHGDTSRMFWIGDKIAIKASQLTKVTHQSMMKGIKAVCPGATLGDVGHAIQHHAEIHGFSVVRDFCGHGLGKTFHAPPAVPHFGQPGGGMVLQEGMFLTIEPMINLGHHGVKVLPDGWTAVTRDQSLSAQFEHSLGVTDHGCEIFTLSPLGHHHPPYRTS